MDLLDRRHFLKGGLALLSIGFSSGCAALPGGAARTRLPRVGFLSIGAQGPGTMIEYCKQALAELGYVENQQYTAEERYANGDIDRLPSLATELIGLPVDVIAAAGALAVEAIKAVSNAVPVVMSNRGDPIGGRLVTNLSRPDSNITGVSGMAVQLSGKRLQLLKETAPSTTRVATLWRPPDESMHAESGETQIAGNSLGVEVQPIEVRAADDFDRAYAMAAASHLDGVIVIAEPLMDGNRRRLVELAIQHRLPTISSDSEYAAAGGLMSYGPKVVDQQRRTAYYVDKILKGAHPADLPIEQPTSFDFTINLKAAEALGLTFPPSVLAQATEVIQ